MSAVRRTLSPMQLAHAKTLVHDGVSVASIAASFGVGRSTLYRALDTASIVELTANRRGLSRSGDLDLSGLTR